MVGIDYVGVRDMGWIQKDIDHVTFIAYIMQSSMREDSVRAFGVVERSDGGDYFRSFGEKDGCFP
jgi:hypothetical protein